MKIIDLIFVNCKFYKIIKMVVNSLIKNDSPPSCHSDHYMDLQFLRIFYDLELFLTEILKYELSKKV